jgi:ribosomal protein L11 methyltransferase
MRSLRATLWRLSIATTREAEDALSEWVGNLFGAAPSSYTDAETGKTTVSVYLHGTAATFRARTRAAAAIGKVKASGLEVGAGKISLVKVRREDWAESWKRHFKPIEIGSALLIKPSWSRRKPQKAQKVVVLDPGLSFGTGQHPTTAFCLRELVKRRSAPEPQSLLDIGCGSGILAIAAAKIGFSPVHALDSDPDALRIALANARRNQLKAAVMNRDGTGSKPAKASARRDPLDKPICFREQNFRTLQMRPATKYCVICANLTSDLLLAERDRILAQLRDCGVLVLAGILKTEFDEIRKAYEAAGLRLIASSTRREWRSGSFAGRERTARPSRRAARPNA